MIRDNEHHHIKIARHENKNDLHRFMGGVADAAAWGSVVSILMKLFPNHVTTIASWTEMLLGLGYMMGKKIANDWLFRKKYQNYNRLL